MQAKTNCYMVDGKLTDIPETMLIPLWARAEESKRKTSLLRDDYALSIVERIDYDFSKFRKAKFSQAGCCIRASLIDTQVQQFLNQHPDAVVVQLGAGLDARYERLGKPMLTHWYDLDVPEAIALRRQLLGESERNTYLSMSMFDYAWIDLVKAHGKPICLVIEGVLMYFSPAEVRAFFQEVCERFDDAVVIFDMLAFALVGNSRRHDSLSKMGDQVEFKWSVLETREMEEWHAKLKVEEDLYMSDYERGRYPALFRLLYKLPYFYRRFNQRVVKLSIGES